MRAYHWTPRGGGENFGDALGPFILGLMGVTVEPPLPGEPCLFSCGSILSESHFRTAAASRVVVWGSGCGFPCRDMPSLDFRAVRGPLTREVFSAECPSGVPLGDPALLLPSLFTPRPVPRYGVLYANHCGVNPPIEPAWADVSTPTLIHAGQPKSTVADVIGLIAHADFVVAESLHAAVVAQAYGVPWAPGSARDRKPSVKWYDWCSYLGIAPPDSFCRDLNAARAWWKDCGARGKMQDTRPLRDAFPKGGL